MSRTPKLICYAAIIEMALVAIALFAWRHAALPGLPAPGPPNPHTQFMLVFLPAWLATSAVFIGWRLASNRPRLSDSHGRFIGGSLQVAAVALAAMQGLFAYVDVTGATLDRPLLLRAFAVFAGLWVAILGNGAAKLDPPTGAGAPVPSVWTRALLRYGWMVVVLGLILVVCALALPSPQPLFFVLIVITAIGLALELAMRRVIRPRRPA
jgi:hypothetical protein